MPGSSSRRRFLTLSAAGAVATVAGCSTGAVAPRGSADSTATTPTAPSATTPSTPSPSSTGPRPGSPADALQALREGNARFVSGPIEMCRPDQIVGIRANLAGGQHPFAVVLTCADSRVPPEVLFDQTLGDLFVVRVAGNVTDPAVIGSIEYAVKHLSPAPGVIVVMGHQRCGAVSAAVGAITPDPATGPGHADDSDEDEIAWLVEQITPAAQATRPAGTIDENAWNLWVDAAIIENVRRSRAELLAHGPLRSPVDAGALMIVPAVYALDTGVVTVLDS